MGHEFAGEVIEVGCAVKASVEDAAIASRAFPYICCGDHTPCINFASAAACARKGIGVGLGQSHGAYAEYVRIGASGGYRLPDSVSFREGAMVEPLAVGLARRRHGEDGARRDRAGDRRGTGRALRPCCGRNSWARVMSSSARRRRCAARWPRNSAPPMPIDPAQPLTPQVEKIAGKAPDIIFECVGVPGLIGQTMMEAPRGGRIVVAGVCQQPDTIMPLMGIVKELDLQFVLGYRPADFDYVIAMIASRPHRCRAYDHRHRRSRRIAGRVRGAAQAVASMQGDAGELSTARSALPGSTSHAARRTSSGAFATCGSPSPKIIVARFAAS